MPSLPSESDQVWLGTRASHPQSLRTHLLTHGSSSGGLRVHTTPHHNNSNDPVSSPLPLPHAREHRLVARMSSTPSPQPSSPSQPEKPQRHQQHQQKEGVSIHVTHPTQPHGHTLPTAIVTAVLTSPDPETLYLRLHRIYTTYDIGNFMLLLLLIAILGSLQAVTPHHRLIINPSDPEINYPHLTETVPSWMLFVLCGLLPVVVIFCIFFYQTRHPIHRRTKREVYYVLFGWALNMVITLVLTEFIKRVTGRPRPNFMQLSGYTLLDGTITYSGSSANVAQAWQSFPSGHSSASFSGLGFLSLYLFRFLHPSFFTSRQQALDYHRNQGWKTVVCFLPILLAIWVSSTRITDYWHNYDDVVSGALIGLIIAIIIFQTHTSWWWNSVIAELSGGKYQEVQMCDMSPNADTAAVYPNTPGFPSEHTHRDLEAQRVGETKMDHHHHQHHHIKMDHQQSSMGIKNRSPQQQQYLRRVDSITIDPASRQLHQYESTGNSYLPITPPADAPLLAVDPEKSNDPIVYSPDDRGYTD